MNQSIINWIEKNPEAVLVIFGILVGLIISIVVIYFVRVYFLRKEYKNKLEIGLKNTKEKIEKTYEEKISELSKKNKEEIEKIESDSKSKLIKELEETKKKKEDTSPLIVSDLVIAKSYLVHQCEDIEFKNLAIQIYHDYTDSIEVPNKINLNEVYLSIKNDMNKIINDVKTKEDLNENQINALYDLIEVNISPEGKDRKQKRIESINNYDITNTENQNEENPSKDDPSGDNNQETGIEDTGSSDDSNEENNTKTEVSDNESDNTSGVGKDKE